MVTHLDPYTYNTSINMSSNLKICAKRLIKFTRLTKTEAKRFLKAVNARLINALSEIAFNIREGTVKVSKRLKNSKLVKTLSQKSTPLKLKYQLLCAAAAPVIVQALVSSVIAVLQAL